MANQAWQTFLNTQPNNASSSASNIMVDLSNHPSHGGLIALSGEDSVTFLQGQVTNDVKQLTNGAHYTGYCTAKGRMLALFYAYQVGQNGQTAPTIYLQCPAELTPAISKRLRMYVLRSKVMVEDLSEQMVQIGVQGPQVREALTSQCASLPSQIHQVTHADGVTFIQLPAQAGVERFQIIAPLAQAQTLWQHLSATCSIANANTWEHIEISSGLPNVYAKTQEQFVPQMLNLDLLGGINFKKGCYTGQEIVARTHYLGSVKRRTFIAHINSTQSPNIGDVVLDAQQADCGQIVRVAQTAQGFDALVECRLEAKQAGALTWQGYTLEWAEMPYAII